MIHIYNHQFEILANIRLQRFILNMIQNFERINAPYLPDTRDEQIKLLLTKTKETKKWGFITDLQVEKFLYLVVHYPELQQETYDNQIIDNLTWPGRDPDDKLNELTMQLFIINSDK